MKNPGSKSGYSLSPWFARAVGHPPQETRPLLQNHGFTLLEVLVTLTILAVGAALTLSLISGSLSNIRKVQLKTRAVEHAEEVMELALLDKSIQKPTSFSGDFEDGCRWSVHVEEHEPSRTRQLQVGETPRKMPVKLLHFTVEMFNPDSIAPDYRLHTLKLVYATEQESPLGLPQ